MEQLIQLCKCEISIEVNPHINFYMSVIDYMDEFRSNVDEAVLNVMIEKNTVIKVQAYPDTPIAFYWVFHHDLNSAISEMIQILVIDNQNNQKFDKYNKGIFDEIHDKYWELKGEADIRSW